MRNLLLISSFLAAYCAFAVPCANASGLVASLSDLNNPSAPPMQLNFSEGPDNTAVLFPIRADLHPTSTAGTSVTTPLDLVVSIGLKFADDATPNQYKIPQPLASIELVGTATYQTQLEADGYSTVVGGASGTLTGKNYTISPGVDPPLVPDWLKNLQGTITGTIGGGLSTTAPAWLRFSAPDSTSPQPVPETSTLLTFAILTVGGMWLRKRRSGSRSLSAADADL